MFRIFQCKWFAMTKNEIDIEVIYVNDDYNFNKLSNEIKTTTKFMEIIYFLFKLESVYWYRFNGDIFTLVATKK